MVHDGTDVPEGPANLDWSGSCSMSRPVSNAGLLVTSTLADRLGIEEVVNESVWLDPRAPGAALPGRKVMPLVHGMLAGADSIDEMNVLRAGSTAPDPGAPGDGAVHAGDVPAGVHLRARPPARPCARSGALPGLAGGGGAG